MGCFFFDRRLKKDIQLLYSALSTVQQLQGVTFNWKDSTKNAQLGRVRGFIAQEVEKVIPEWVKTQSNGYKQLETIGMDALLVEAIKVQQKMIETQQKQYEAQQKLIESWQASHKSLELKIESTPKTHLSYI